MSHSIISSSLLLLTLRSPRLRLVKLPRIRSLWLRSGLLLLGYWLLLRNWTWIAVCSLKWRTCISAAWVIDALWLVVQALRLNHLNTFIQWVPLLRRSKGYWVRLKPALTANNIWLRGVPWGILSLEHCVILLLLLQVRGGRGCLGCS